jgi:hypothetical protein
LLGTRRNPIHHGAAAYRVSARLMPARVPRLQPSKGERPQDSDDGEEKNGMASLVVYCWKNKLGLHFIPQPGCRYLSASVALGAAAPGIEQWFVEWMLDDQREKTIPFSTSWMEWRAAAFPRHNPDKPTRARRRPRSPNRPASARR